MCLLSALDGNDGKIVSLGFSIHIVNIFHVIPTLINNVLHATDQQKQAMT